MNKTIPSKQTATKNPKQNNESKPFAPDGKTASLGAVCCPTILEIIVQNRGSQCLSSYM
jgi:hypothetical protein